MPFFSSIRAIGPTGARRLLAKLKAFTDSFTRGNSASAIGEDVAKWSSVRGTWGILNNRAHTTTATSSYPIATFDAITKDVSIKATASGSGAGYGVSFWVADQNNWWGAVTEKTSYTAAPYNCTSANHTANNTTGNCTYSYGASGGPSYNVGGGPYPCGCSGCGPQCQPFGWTCFYLDHANCCWTPAGPSPACPAPYNYHPYNAPYNCPSGGAVSGSNCVVTYGGSASTWFAHDVKVLKSESGTVNTVSTTNIGNVLTNSSSYISYVRANTSATNATVTAELSTGGSPVNINVSAGGSTTSSKFGIIAAPATLSPTTEIESFEYTPL